MHRSSSRSSPVRALAALAAAGVAAAATLSPAEGLEPEHHLVVSEVMTGGASASDEFIELYNPGAVAAPLEGLELIYVSASGTTVSRRALWEAGAPLVPAGGHVLVAHEAGVFAGIADALYGSGIAAAGGSVALRIQGASEPLDAVGWGTASSAWMEGQAAPAPAAGSSIERLPGGEAGSTQDTGNNLVDFVVREVPDPQNLSSPPVPDPGPTPLPTPPPTASPAVSPSPSSTPSPWPPVPVTVPIVDARLLPDGSRVTIGGVALTGSEFADGGGYVDDGTAGLAILVTGGAFARGDRIEVHGEIGNRFHQRTLRAAGADLTIVGAGSDPSPAAVGTGAVGEAVEGRLVSIGGSITGSPTQLAAGLAFDVDDGSGSARVVVANATGIDTARWVRHATVQLIGVVGQRDSTGGGTAGYRVQPRDPGDVVAVAPPAGPPPSAAPSSAGAPSGTDAGVLLTSVVDARAAEPGTTLRVRGVVTLPSDLVEAGSAVIQDASGAILLRLGAGAGTLGRGEHVEVVGRRATKAGMASLQVSGPPTRLGTQGEPAPLRIQTGAAGEAHEARLVTVRGALVANARRAASGTVSFEIDDGSGSLRIHAAPPLEASPDPLRSGAWVEVTGVLGQQTTGAEPLAGYRVWPRLRGELVVLAGATSGAGSSAAAALGGSGGAAAFATLEQLLGGAVADGEIVEATLVLGPWSQLGVSGLIWDGERLVALADDSATGGEVERFRSLADPPVSVELSDVARAGLHDLGIPLLALPYAGSMVPGSGAVAPPLDALPRTDAAWVALVGRASTEGGAPWLRTAGGRVALDIACDRSPLPDDDGVVRLVGIGIGEPPRLIPACDSGLRGPQLGSAADERPRQADTPVATPIVAASVAPDRRAPAALLGGSAALLAGAAGWAAWTRRRRRGSAPTTQPTETATEPAAGTPGPEPGRLALVSLQHEERSR